MLQVFGAMMPLIASAMYAGGVKSLGDRVQGTATSKLKEKPYTRTIPGPKGPSQSRQFKDMLQTASRAGVGKPQMQTRAQTRAEAQMKKAKIALEQQNIKSKLAREKAIAEELRDKEEKYAARRMYAKQGVDLRMNTLPGAKKPTTGDVEFTKKSKTLPPLRRNTNGITVGRGTRAQRARFAQRMKNKTKRNVSRKFKKIPKFGKIKKRSKYKKGKQKSKK